MLRTIQYPASLQQVNHNLIGTESDPSSTCDLHWNEPPKTSRPWMWQNRKLLSRICDKAVASFRLPAILATFDLQAWARKAGEASFWRPVLRERGTIPSVCQLVTYFVQLQMTWNRACWERERERSFVRSFVGGRENERKPGMNQNERERELFWYNGLALVSSVNPPWTQCSSPSLVQSLVSEDNGCSIVPLSDTVLSLPSSTCQSPGISPCT